jgi:lactate dehydrogenase-like 2-hydroxyacid dehydrogenase
MRPRIFNCTYAALSGAVHERLAGVGEVHPYRPNVIALPHVGAATHETREALALMAADNVVAVLTGRPPRAIVNPEVLGGPHKGSD